MPLFSSLLSCNENTEDALPRVGEDKLEIVQEVEAGILPEASELTENQLNYASELTENQLNYAVDKEIIGKFGHEKSQQM
jgi:hypothetical protein